MSHSPLTNLNPQFPAAPSNLNMMNMNNLAAAAGGGGGISISPLGGLGGPQSQWTPSVAGGVGGNVNVNIGNMGIGVQRLALRHPVHIIWDIDHVPIPPAMPEICVINSLVALAERECQGFVESFVACCREGTLDLKSKLMLQDSGVQIEEIGRRSLDNYLLTRLLALSLQMSMNQRQAATASSQKLLQIASSPSASSGLLSGQYGNHSSNHPRPILIIITGDRDIALALKIICGSGIFQEIVLLHTPSGSYENQELRFAATKAIEWISFLSLQSMAMGGPSQVTPLASSILTQQQQQHQHHQPQPQHGGGRSTPSTPLSSIQQSSSQQQLSSPVQQSLLPQQHQSIQQQQQQQQTQQSQQSQQQGPQQQPSQQQPQQQQIHGPPPGIPHRVRTPSSTPESRYRAMNENTNLNMIPSSPTPSSSSLLSIDEGGQAGGGRGGGQGGPTPSSSNIRGSPPSTPSSILERASLMERTGGGDWRDNKDKPISISSLSRASSSSASTPLSTTSSSARKSAESDNWRSSAVQQQSGSGTPLASLTGGGSGVGGGGLLSPHPPASSSLASFSSSLSSSQLSTGGSGGEGTPSTPYRTPYQRQLARRNVAGGVSTPTGGSIQVGPRTGGGTTSPSASPPSSNRPLISSSHLIQQTGGTSGDVRISDIIERRERERMKQQQQQTGSGGTPTGTSAQQQQIHDEEGHLPHDDQSMISSRSRSGSTASYGGRINLDDHHPQQLTPAPSGGVLISPSGGGQQQGGDKHGHTREPTSYAAALSKSASAPTTPSAGASSGGTNIATLTPRTPSTSAKTPTTPLAGGTSASTTSASTTTGTTGSITPTSASTIGGPNSIREQRAAQAIRLFGHVMNVCSEEKIIPRESVIRSKLEDTSIWDNKRDPHHVPPPVGLKSWASLHMEFDTWLDLIINRRACVCVGVAPQRVLWPHPPQTRFECADYFRPQERLNAQEMTTLIEFLVNNELQSHQNVGGSGQVDRGRYGFANYLKSCGPQFVREMPRGYVVELVQLLLNKNFLQFKKGKVSFKSTAAGRWKRALESVESNRQGKTDDEGGTSSDHQLSDNEEDQQLSSSSSSSQSRQATSPSIGGSPPRSVTSRSSGSTTPIGSSSSMMTTLSGGENAANKPVDSSTPIGGGRSLMITSSRPGTGMKSVTSVLTPSSSPVQSSRGVTPGNITPLGSSSRLSPVISGTSSPIRSLSFDRSGPSTPSMMMSTTSGSIMSTGSSSSTPTTPVGPSLDFDDPVELLAVKCAESPAPGVTPIPITSGSSSSSTMSMGSSTPTPSSINQVFYPLYHFEKSGEQHAPLWVCVVTLDVRYPPGRQPIGSVATSPSLIPPLSTMRHHRLGGDEEGGMERPKRFRSTRKQKKLEAQQEAAMRAIESNYWKEAFTPPEGMHHPIDKDYVPQLLDDPVVTLDRLLVALEQAPVVYTMESVMNQHQGNTRTLWTCGVQISLRPRPAHLTSGTISIEQAELGDTGNEDTANPANGGNNTGGSGTIKYPSIKWSTSQAKKFDAKSQVAMHVLTMLEKSKHRYPMLFMAHPEPLPPRPKTLLMPNMSPLVTQSTAISLSQASSSSSSSSMGMPSSIEASSSSSKYDDSKNEGNVPSLSSLPSTSSSLAPSTSSISTSCDVSTSSTSASSPAIKEEEKKSNHSTASMNAPNESGSSSSSSSSSESSSPSSSSPIGVIETSSSQPSTTSSPDSTPSSGVSDDPRPADLPSVGGCSYV